MRLMSATRAAAQILLIDDHALIRSGLRMVVQSGVPGAVLREAGSIAEALRDALARGAMWPGRLTRRWCWRARMRRRW